jgi:hypothetical protein
MRVRRTDVRAVEVPVAALTDPFALVAALSGARLAAGLPVANKTHEQVDRQLVAADDLLRALDPAEAANRFAA